MSEEHTPYFSKRIRIGDVKSPKELVGFKEFTVEVTIGNQESIIIRNKEDIAEIKDNKNIFDLVEEIYKQRDEWNKKSGRNFKFLDERKEEDPLKK